VRLKPSRLGRQAALSEEVKDKYGLFLALSCYRVCQTLMNGAGHLYSPFSLFGPQKAVLLDLALSN
jgi:hypothetical protein